MQGDLAVARPELDPRDDRFLICRGETCQSSFVSQELLTAQSFFGRRRLTGLDLSGGIDRGRTSLQTANLVPDEISQNLTQIGKEPFSTLRLETVEMPQGSEHSLLDQVVCVESLPSPEG